MLLFLIALLGATCMGNETNDKVSEYHEGISDSRILHLTRSTTLDKYRKFVRQIEKIYKIPQHTVVIGM